MTRILGSMLLGAVALTFASAAHAGDKGGDGRDWRGSSGKAYGSYDSGHGPYGDCWGHYPKSEPSCYPPCYPPRALTVLPAHVPVLLPALVRYGQRLLSPERLRLRRLLREPLQEVVRTHDEVSAHGPVPFGGPRR